MVDGSGKIAHLGACHEMLLVGVSSRDWKRKSCNAMIDALVTESS